MSPSEGDVTALLVAWSNGDRAALDALVPLVHLDLVARARRYLARERAGHPLQSRALVNEAYLRLVDMARVDWQNRAHFFAVAARLMRRILIDVARANNGLKRGGGVAIVALEDVPEAALAQPPYDVLDLHVALETLTSIDPRRGRVVELRVFGGLTLEETAAALGVSSDTVSRDWALAKAWLGQELGIGRRDP